MKTELFAMQGRHRRNFFEGWYVKVVTPGGDAYAFIPGLACDRNGECHSFVQVIRGSDGYTANERFPQEEFYADSHQFAVGVGQNRFGFEGISLDLPGLLGGIHGRLRFGAPRRLTSQGDRLRPIMGWYRHVPFMQCYHELGSAAHTVSGALTIDGQSISFDGGRGYLEKDWGRSMPEWWVWMQCNGFEDGTAFMISIARIPWLGRSFPGFLGFIAPGEQAPVPFGTWSGARVTRLIVEGKNVTLQVVSPHWSLDVQGERNHGGLLAAPVAGAMERRIAESLDGRITLRMADRDGKLLAEGSGGSAGIEVVGDVEQV